jgi:hypothetical protein
MLRGTHATNGDSNADASNKLFKDAQMIALTSDSNLTYVLHGKICCGTCWRTLRLSNVCPRPAKKKKKLECDFGF